MKNLLPLALALALLLASCAPGSPGLSMTGSVSTAESGVVYPATLPPAGYTPPPYPTEAPPTPIPPLSGDLSPTELKYLILEKYPDFFFCDPDYYPVAHEDELSLALARFPQIQSGTEQFQAILEHNGLAGLASFSDDQKLLIYRDYKKLNALFFELAGDAYQFQFLAAQQEGEGVLIRGTIDAQGEIRVVSKEKTFAACPICLALGTRIDTPRGPVPVQDLRAGDLVWTVNSRGERVSAPVAQVGHTSVPASHRVLHLLLEDGRELWVSPGHPAADGRPLGTLKPGDLLDGSRVQDIQLLPYLDSATYDLLPSGDTGLYWADGILIASTLGR